MPMTTLDIRELCSRFTRPSEPAKLRLMALHALPEAALPHALLGEPFQIKLGRQELRLVAESFRFGDQHAVLVHHGMPVPTEVRRGFARSRGGV
jgi:hypothetical protein